MKYRHRVLGLLILLFAITYIDRVSISVAGPRMCLFTLAVMVTRQRLLVVVLLSLVYGAITFQQSGVFGVCLDIGRKHAGSMVGLMNTSAQVGGLLSSVAYGYIVDRFHSYDAPLYQWRLCCSWARFSGSR